MYIVETRSRVKEKNICLQLGPTIPILEGQLLCAKNHSSLKRMHVFYSK